MPRATSHERGVLSRLLPSLLLRLVGRRRFLCVFLSILALLSRRTRAYAARKSFNPLLHESYKLSRYLSPRRITQIIRRHRIDDSPHKMRRDLIFNQIAHGVVTTVVCSAAGALTPSPAPTSGRGSRSSLCLIVVVLSLFVLLGRCVAQKKNDGGDLGCIGLDSRPRAHPAGQHGPCAEVR